MGDIFKTKAVLQRIPGKRNDQKPMREVRGVYVSGMFLPIEYSNNAIMITKLKHHKADVVDYTERSTSGTIDKNLSGTFAVCDIDINPNVQVDYYSQKSISTTIDDTKKYNHGAFAICDIDINNEVELLLYTQKNESVIIDKNNHGTFAICDIDFPLGYSLENYYHVYGDKQHDDCLMIRKIKITKATIENVT